VDPETGKKVKNDEGVKDEPMEVNHTPEEDKENSQNKVYGWSIFPPFVCFTN